MHIKFFSELNKDDVATAGGKGASLGEMYNSSIPVPDGFVVLSSAFDEFLKSAGLEVEIASILKPLASDDINVIDAASKQIQKFVLESSIPAGIADEIKDSFAKLGAEFVAVRSSATAEDSSSDAWAGQLDSFLNSTEGNVVENVRKCWASLFTPRAIFYRIEKGLADHHISVAVVVQKMVDSEKSGIAFSIQPITQDTNSMVIEAGFGLGEAIVSGQITPDDYIVQKSPLAIIEKTINVQRKALYRNGWKDIDHGGGQAISDGQILELAKEIVRIENHYGFAVDIEWAYESGRLHILQSRPITTSGNAAGAAREGKNIFTLSYTRDRSIITQQGWFYGHAEGLEKLAGITLRNKIPMVLYYNDGPVDIWDNEKALAEIKEAIAAKNEKEPEFVKKLIAEFDAREEAYFKPVWEQKSTDDAFKLAEISNAFYDLLPHYSYIYYTLLSESADDKYKKDVEKWKEKDVFFENTGQFIERSIERIYPDLSFLTKYIKMEEISNPPSKEELAARRKNWIYATGFADETTSLDDFSSKNPAFVFKREAYDPNMTVFYGQTASVGGVFKGKARLLRTREEMHKVEDGDIIVAPMTIPEFLPAMKKAAAFVNDEGGMLSHAAVVARELKKPCILDTKFATRVIKDGDMLEVDADNGIVRIIRKVVD